MKTLKFLLILQCMALLPGLQAQDIVLWIAEADGAPVVGQPVDVTLNIKCGDVEINDMFMGTPGDLGILTRDISDLFSGQALDPKETCTFSYTVLVGGETVSVQDQPLPPIIRARTAEKAVTAEAVQPPPEIFSGNVLLPWHTRTPDNTEQQWSDLQIQDGEYNWYVRAFENQGGQLSSEMIEIPPSLFTELDNLIFGERYTITVDAQGNFGYDAFNIPPPPLAKGTDKNYQLQVPSTGNPGWVDGIPPAPTDLGNFILETEVTGVTEQGWRLIDPSLFDLPPPPEDDGDFSLKVENSSFSWSEAVPAPPGLDGSYALQVQNSGSEASWATIPPPPPQQEGFFLLEGEEDQNMNINHSWTSDLPFVNRPETNPSDETVLFLEFTFDQNNQPLFRWTELGTLLPTIAPGTEGALSPLVRQGFPTSWINIQNIGLPTEEFLNSQVSFDNSFTFEDLQDQAANGTLPPGNFYEDPNTGKKFHSINYFDTDGNKIHGLQQVKPAQPLWQKDPLEFDTWHKQGNDESKWNFPGSVIVQNTASTTQINVTDGINNYGLMTDDFVCAEGFVQTSDKRIKENILSLQSSLATVMNLHPTTYNLKGDDSNRSHFGFLAQEVEAVAPELVMEVDWSRIGPHPSGIKGGIKAVNYIGMIPLLTRATQEQQQLVEAQEKRIDEQDKRIAELEAQVKLLLEAIEK